MFVFVLLYITLRQFYFFQIICNHREEEQKAGCFAVIVLQIFCYYNCSVTLPYGAVGLSAVCDCVIS